MKVETDLEIMYREFDVVRRGFMNYEPVTIGRINSQTVTYKTLTRFWTKNQAMRVSQLMRAQYNDGLWISELQSGVKEIEDATQ
jgi:hypothetical protein